MISDISQNGALVILDINKDQSYNEQLLSIGKKIADSRNKILTAIAIGYFNDEKCGYGKFGLDHMIEMDIYSVSSCIEIIKCIKPFIILGCSTDDNKTLLAQISIELKCGLVADCINIRFSDDNYIFSRAAVNDSVIADIKCVNSDYMACTIKKGCFRPSEITGSITYHNYQGKKEFEENEYVELLSSETVEYERNWMKNSKIVIGIGRGAIKYIDLINNFAQKIGADIAVSRPLVDMGLAEREQQVGQSGKALDCDLYIALGISGAVQHIVGMSAVKKVIAVNTDEEAPIFDYADYIVTEDVEVFLKKLIEKVEDNHE